MSVLSNGTIIVLPSTSFLQHSLVSSGGYGPQNTAVGGIQTLWEMGGSGNRHDSELLSRPKYIDYSQIT
jgi:hypothetical protein